MRRQLVLWLGSASPISRGTRFTDAMNLPIMSIMTIFLQHTKIYGREFANEA